MSENKNEAIEIVNEIINGPAMLFHDQYNVAFIAPTGNGSAVMKINSSEFRTWLSGKLWKDYSDVISTTTISNVVQTLTGAAKHEDRSRALDVRASYGSQKLWYDCGNSVIEIDKEDWAIVDIPPVKFRRFSHQKNQTLPARTGEITDLINFVNINSEDDILLFLVFTVSAFIPGFPHPILILYGPQGAGKSTPMRLIKELVDPSTIQGVPAPKDVGAFAQLAHHHYLLVFDNLSGMPTWFSDALARASTGDGFSKRALYTDDDDIVYKIQRTIALNGINQVATKADLLDRSILIGLKRIDPEQRIPEEEFWKEFNEKKPGILGAIFSVISKAMTIYPTVELDKLPRMADFAKWGYAIAEAAGFNGETFIAAYQKNIDRQNEEAIEASPVAQAVIEFMKDKDEWADTAAVLLQRLNQIAVFNDLKSSVLWPKDPQWLAKRLNEVEPNMQSRGIFFTKYVKDLSRIIHLTRSSVNNQKSNSITVETAPEPATKF